MFTSIRPQSRWLKFSESLPTEVNITVGFADFEKLNDFLTRQPGVIPPKAQMAVKQSLSDFSGRMLNIKIRFGHFGN